MVSASERMVNVSNWPFPSELPPKKPNDNLPPKYNPANDDPSPL